LARFGLDPDVAVTDETLPGTLDECIGRRRDVRSVPSRHRRLRTVGGIGFVGRATALPEVIWPTDRHIDGLVGRTTAVFVRAHPDRTAVVIIASGGHAQLGCTVAARSCDQRPASPAGRVGGEVAAAVRGAAGAK
jgi:hypothetical protein